jgi:hypothetical protein
MTVESAPSYGAAKALVVAILSDSPNAFAMPEDPDAIRSTLIDLANYARSLEKELMRARRREALADVSSFPDAGTSPDSIGGSLEDDNSDYSETEALSEQFSNIALSRGHNRHFGKSSSAMFFMTLFDIKEHMKIKKRPEFWTLFPVSGNLLLKCLKFKNLSLVAAKSAIGIPIIFIRFPGRGAYQQVDRRFFHPT